MTTLGFIGAGHLASQLARLAVSHDYDVVVSNSRGPETLQELVAELGPHARAATPSEAVVAGDLVIVSIPFGALGTLPVAELAGKIVIDTTNYYPRRDGTIAALDEERTTTSELLQAHLPESGVVKAFNHMLAPMLTADPRPDGDEERRALIAAGDDPAARARVTALIEEFGFEPLDIGPLAEGWRIQRDTPGHGKSLTAFELRNALVSALLYRDM